MSVVFKLLFVAVFGSILAACGMHPPTSNESEPTPARAEISRRTSEPYTGPLDIFEDPKREENLQIDRVMDILGVSEGKNVADIGAGSGWFTVRAARRVAPGGKVFAVEINPDYIKYIDERAKQEELANIETVLGKPDDPLLPPSMIDVVLILKTYHEIEQPVEVMERLRTSLRSGAKVGIIDKNGTGSDHGIGRDTLLDEVNKAGFELIEEYEFVKPDGMDYFLVLRLKDNVVQGV